MDTLNIATWNILYDNQGLYGTSAQSDRQGSIVQTLDDLDMQLDAVGLLEVEDNQQSGHHGRNISRELTGGDGYWVTNKNAAEDLGLFGKKINDISTLDLAGGRTMVVTHINSVAIALTHFTFNIWSDKLRTQQALQVISHTAKYDKVVLMGDFNSASWQHSRRIIEQAGFVSVFQALGRRRPPTILTEKYRQRLSRIYRVATTYGFSPDDIYVRGLRVLDAGVFEGDSDHRGVWAKITTHPD